MCEEEPNFYRKDFRKYAFGHNNFEWRNKRYIEIYGPPKCKVCNVEVGFVRSKPMKYCSHVCSDKDVGFTNPKTKEAIKQVMQKNMELIALFNFHI